MEINIEFERKNGGNNFFHLKFFTFYFAFVIGSAMYSRNNLFKRGISQRKFSYKSTIVQSNSEPFDKSCHQRPDIPLYALVEAIALMNEKNYSTEGTEREEITGMSILYFVIVYDMDFFLFKINFSNTNCTRFI